MEISLLKDKSIRIKGKTGSALIRGDEFTLTSNANEHSKTFSGGGEYEVGGVSVIGIQNNENNIYVFETDGLRVCYIEEGTKKLSDSKLTLIGDIDVLLLPATHDSTEILNQIESYYVVPFAHDNEDDLKKFLTEASLVTKNLPKLSIKKDEIIEDQATEIIILEAKN